MPARRRQGGARSTKTTFRQPISIPCIIKRVKKAKLLYRNRFFSHIAIRRPQGSPPTRIRVSLRKQSIPNKSTSRFMAVCFSHYSSIFALTRFGQGDKIVQSRRSKKAQPRVALTFIPRSGIKLSFSLGQTCSTLRGFFKFSSTI